MSGIPHFFKRASAAVCVLWCLTSAHGYAYELKPGASLEGLCPEVMQIIPVLEDIFNRHGKILVITSGTEEFRRVRGSKHPEGNAIDIRTRHLSTVQRGVQGRAQKYTVLKQIQTAPELRDFDVLLEYENSHQEHIHVEYDP